VARAREFWEGCRDCLPLMVGGIPVGITCGVMSVAAGFSPFEATVMSLAVFSGAAQLVALSIFIAGGGLALIILNVFLVNLHNLLLTSSLAPHLLKQPRPLWLLLCASLTDGTYAITVDRADKAGYSAYYQLGASAVQYFFWFAATVAGALAGSHILNPRAWGLDFTLTAVFVAILVPKLRDPVAGAVSAIAAATAVAGSLYLGGRWYILIACIVAVVAGVALERRLAGK
jgi:4-azaleucine resistance transporter AzlC